MRISRVSDDEHLDDTSVTARYPADAAVIGPAIGPAGEMDHALAFALTKATEAGRFDVVAQLARELEARRLASSLNVVTLAARKRT